MADQEILEELIRRIKNLERQLTTLSNQRKRFEILNVNTPAQLTSNVNNYDPGNYDYLRMTSDASRNITGISGGTPGRVLILYNFGSFNIVLVHNSASSLAANRIFIPTSTNITMTPTSIGTFSTVVLIYPLQSWIPLVRYAP